MSTTMQQAGLFAPPSPSPDRDLPFLAWHDGDKKKPTAEKVQDAIDRFRRKWGVDPTVVLTSCADAAELAGFDELDVQPKTFIQRHDYYVGVRA